MNPQELIESYNSSNAGSQTRKDVFREISENKCLIFLKPQGMIWPKKLAGDKLFSYTISTNQILIRNHLGDMVRKVRFADISKMEATGSSERFIIIILTIEEKNNPP